MCRIKKVVSYLNVNGSGSVDISDTLACDLVAIPTSSPSDTSLEHYHYTKPSSSWATTYPSRGHTNFRLALAPRSSGILPGVGCCSGKHIGPIVMGQFLGYLVLDSGTDTLYQNVGNQVPSSACPISL